jgi:hypothetical protein
VNRPLDALNALLAMQMEALCRALLGEPTMRLGHDWRWGRKGSLSVAMSGARRGAWHNHEAGIGGGPVSLVAHAMRCPVAEAIRWAWSWLGEEPARCEYRPILRNPTACVDDDASRIAQALALWRAGIPIEGTPADCYLRARGVDPSRLPPHVGLTGWPSTLAWHAGIGALLVAVNHAASGTICAVQRIFLRNDGTARVGNNGKKLKLGLGPTGGGNAARFGWEPDPQGRWAIAEGAEDALATAQMFGFPAVTGFGTGGMSRIAPPSWVRHVSLVPDHDDAGMDAAFAAAQAMGSRGLAVSIVRPTRPGADPADVLREGSQ